MNTRVAGIPHYVQLTAETLGRVPCYRRQRDRSSLLLTNRRRRRRVGARLFASSLPPLLRRSLLRSNRTLLISILSARYIRTRYNAGIKRASRTYS